MRLWHEALLPFLSRKRLLSQHRECCALRGKGWGKKHSTIDYAFKYHPFYLYQYHLRVIAEMNKRGYSVDTAWLSILYRGKHCDEWPIDILDEQGKQLMNSIYGMTAPKYVFPEHNDTYLKECLEILEKKGEHIPWEL